MNLALKRRVRLGAKQAFVQLHETSARLGLFVLPKHYYVPLPDLRELRRTRDRWAHRSELRGVAVDMEGQVGRLRAMMQPFEPEYRQNTVFDSAVSGGFGPGFGYIEAQALHGFVRSAKPRRIVEVGSGVSTSCMLEAGRRNAADGRPAEITCIEPHPSDWLRSAPVSLQQSRVEDVDIAVFDRLDDGDLLFIDSTHTVRVGGDVSRIILEVLPRLRPGVFVHFHDIFLPFDYQRDAERSIFQWMETALLHAYLIGNAHVEIVFCLSLLHYDRPDVLREVFPEYAPMEGAHGLGPELVVSGRHFPSSIYLRTARAPGAAA